ncbi:MAG: phytanoyl-CoA dioxygenase family protein [Phycisphaeraceae bacterium]
MPAITTPHPVPPTVTPERIAFYRRNGFVHIPNIITKDEAARFRQAALDAAGRMTSEHKNDIFTQLVNVWREDPAMKPLTFHPHVAAAAVALAGVKLRLWHDHILIKKPHNQAPTEFHQDQPYWPHADSTHPLSAWIALCDVPVERGCMTFIPESQKYTDLPSQNLADDKSLMTLCPPLRWDPRVTVPLHAGDCTFHHGRCTT